MELLIYSVLTLLLATAALHRNSKPALFLLQITPLAFLAVFLWVHHGNYQVLQVQKHGYQFRKITADHRNPARQITLGGSRSRDDIYVSGFQPGALRLLPSLTDRSLQVAVATDGMLIFRNDEPLNAFVLNDRDTIRAGTEELQFQSSGSYGRKFTANEKEWSWPRKQNSSARVRNNILTTGLESNLFPLSIIAQSLGKNFNGNTAVTLERTHFSLSRQPVRLNRVLLLGAAPGTTVNGIPLPEEFRYEDGDDLRIFRIENPDQNIRLRLGAAFKIRNTQTIDLLHPIPQTLGMKEELLRNGSASNKPLLISTSSLPYSVFPTTHYSRESQNFSGLIAFIQTEQAPLPDPDLMKRAMGFVLPGNHLEMEVVTEEGSFRPGLGNVFALGQTDKILFSINRVDFPWRLLEALLVLFLLKMIFQPPFLSISESRPLVLLAITVDFFLATRFLFAFRAATVYPFSQEAVPLSFLALLLVPYFLFCGVLFRRARLNRRALTHFVSYTALLVLLSWAYLTTYLWLVLLFCLLMVSFAIAMHHPRVPREAILRKAQTLKHMSAEAYFGVFFLLVVILYLAGTGEAIRIAGMRIPLAMLYHPVLLVFTAHYLYRFRQVLFGARTEATRGEVAAILLKAFGIVGAGFVIALLTRDAGFFLVYCLPLLFLLFGCAVLLISEYELKWKALGLAAAAPPVIVFVFLTGATLLDGLLPSSYYDNRYIQRLLLTLNPAILEESGLIATEAQLGHQRVFLAYSHSGLAGGGYMERPINAALAATALNDNVPSAFLLNDFGALGFVAVISILLFWLWLWRKETGPSFLRFPHFLSITALISLVYADAYMILANCGILPFTGKNVFLWGLNSISDIVHASLLLLFIIVPLSRPLTVEVLPAREKDATNSAE